MELVLSENEALPTLCLNMIVKNESKIITRLFDSVISIIDCYCICDTNSTDDTIEIITEYFKSKNIPGKIVSEPFINFCYNRNFALKSCLQMSDYVLLLDADMIVEMKDFDKKILKTADSFNVLQGNDSFYYQNMRIVKNNGLYNYVGVTHEYINSPSNNVLMHLTKNSFFIRDIGDGGAKHDKFERDIRLLLQGIAEEPTNVRYYFYLANSYRDSGKMEEAIESYKKRIQMGGWKEEVWYSYYRIGLCYKHMGKISDAFYYWMEGYEYYPDRLEGFYEIIKYCRLESKHKLGMMFYQQAQAILDLNHKRDDYLFLHNDVYTDKIYYEFSILACYVGIKNINDAAIKILNNSKNDGDINNLLQNMKFYKDILKCTTVHNLDSNMTYTANNDFSAKMTSSSSCLLPNKNNNGYIMNARYVNYHIDSQGAYHNCDKHIVTVNKYVELDANLNIITEKRISPPFDSRRYIGVEDVRVFNDSATNELIFIGTGYHQNNTIGIVAGKYDCENATIAFSEISATFKNSSCEKNWVYVDYKNETHIIYNWFPLEICKIDYNKNELNLVEKVELPLIFSRVRGSTCGFKYHRSDSVNEIWFIVHLVSYEQPRHYYHMIVVFDDNLRLLRYSAPFKFEGEPIEYCLSILVEDERVLINYSTWDRTTRIGVYDKKYIDSIVKYN